ncbi:MAG: tail fiber domain-containing protein [Candidatus Pacebacteria bacterium]|nr:tail fiber domain-containing protein [Candidatus Paceibacterota bacterium]
MSYTTHYKVSILGALISSIAFTAFAVFAIAPGETLDPVNTHNNVCSGPTDSGCAINPYDGLDPNSVLFLNNAGELSTAEGFTYDFDNGEIMMVSDSVAPDFLTIMGISANGTIPGANMVHVDETTDESNFVAVGDGTAFGLGEHVTIVGYGGASGESSTMLFAPQRASLFLLSDGGNIRTGFNVTDTSFASQFSDLVINKESTMELDATEASFRYEDTGANDRSELSLSSEYAQLYVDTITGAQSISLDDSGITFDFSGDWYTFPIADGALGQVLQTDGNGQLSWATVSGGSSSITIGASGDTLYSSGLSGTGQGRTIGGGGNIILGDNAGNGATNVYSVNFLGGGAGQNAVDATESNFLGNGAGQDATNAYQSNFFGVGAGASATSASSSNFFGANAGINASNANGSNFLGASAGDSATNASNSNFLGRTAGNSATNAAHSNFFGNSAGQGATNAYNSTFIGSKAGFFSVGVAGSANSNNSIFIGNSAGSQAGDLALNNSTANFTSILIGDETSTGGFSNSIAIGKGATNTATNQFMIGSTLATGSIESVRIQAATTNCIITTGTGIACSSDERLKTNIVDMSNILDKVLQLRTVTYNWNDKPETHPQIGFLAQNLEQYFPELVATNEEGFKSVYYAQMAPILVEAVRELDLKVSILESQTIASGGFSLALLTTLAKDFLADVGNGIQNIFAKKITTEELCVENVCFDKEEAEMLKRLIHTGVITDSDDLEEGDVIINDENVVVDEESISDEDIPLIEEESTIEILEVLESEDEVEQSEIVDEIESEDPEETVETPEEQSDSIE